MADEAFVWWELFRQHILTTKAEQSSMMDCLPASSIIVRPEGLIRFNELWVTTFVRVG
jgi:hypothetical protein